MRHGESYYIYPSDQLEDRVWFDEPITFSELIVTGLVLLDTQLIVLFDTTEEAYKTHEIIEVVDELWELEIYAVYRWTVFSGLDRTMLSAINKIANLLN